MKKEFKNTRFGKLLKSKGAKIIGDLVIGTVAPTKPLIGLVVGAVSGATEGFKVIKKSNVNSEGGGHGKVNPAQIAGYITAALIVAYVLGLIDEETFNFASEQLEIIK